MTEPVDPLVAADVEAKRLITQLARNYACEALECLLYMRAPEDLAGTVNTMGSLQRDATENLSLSIQLMNRAGVTDGDN